MRKIINSDFLVQKINFKAQRSIKICPKNLIVAQERPTTHDPDPGTGRAGRMAAARARVWAFGPSPTHA